MAIKNDMKMSRIIFVLFHSKPKDKHTFLSCMIFLKVNKLCIQRTARYYKYFLTRLMFTCSFLLKQGIIIYFFFFKYKCFLFFLFLYIPLYCVPNLEWDLVLEQIALYMLNLLSILYSKTNPVLLIFPL